VDGGTDPFNPPFIKYRIRAFTVPVTSRAILVAIENTGYILFPIGVSDDLKRMLERFVDTIAEVVEEQNVRNLFTDYYKKAEILVDTHCTKENIRDKIYFKRLRFGLFQTTESSRIAEFLVHLYVQC